MKKELGFELDKVKDELSELEKFEKLKVELDDKLLDQRKTMEKSVKEYDTKIQNEQKKYQHLIGDIENEEKVLVEEEKDSLALEEQEKKLYQKIVLLKDDIKEIENKIKGKDDMVKGYRKHIEDLKRVASTFKKDIMSQRKELIPLVDEAKAREKEIGKMQDVILKKLAAHNKDIKETKEVTDKFQQFFDQKLKIEELLTTINKDRDDLEKTLRAVIKKAQSFQIIGKEKNVGKNIIELEKLFGEVEKKKSFFEEELNKLKKLIGR